MHFCSKVLIEHWEREHGNRGARWWQTWRPSVTDEALLTRCGHAASRDSCSKGRRTFEKHGGFRSFVADGLQGVEDDMDGARSICSWIWVVYLNVR